MNETQSELQPPANTPPVAVAFEGDEIEKLGDQIAALSPERAKKLSAYLMQVYGILHWGS